MKVILIVSCQLKKKKYETYTYIALNNIKTDNVPF